VGAPCFFFFACARPGIGSARHRVGAGGHQKGARKIRGPPLGGRFHELGELMQKRICGRGENGGGGGAAAWGGGWVRKRAREGPRAPHDAMVFSRPLPSTPVPRAGQAVSLKTIGGCVGANANPFIGGRKGRGRGWKDGMVFFFLVCVFGGALRAWKSRGGGGRYPRDGGYSLPFPRGTSSAQS
jgi:hypothetical protein